MSSQTTKNMIGALQAVAEYGHQKHWDPARTFKNARMTIAAIKTESNGHMYANRKVAKSMHLPHDAVGQDHDSVGLLQQRVGLDGSNAHGWGTVQQAMDIRHSVRAFLDRADSKGLTVMNLPKGLKSYNGRPVVDIYDRIQCVQVSWYDGTVRARPFGGNYRAQRTWSWLFMKRYWNAKTGTARSKVNYL